VAVETKQVRAGWDTILGYVERASPVDILAEQKAEGVYPYQGEIDLPVQFLRRSSRFSSARRSTRMTFSMIVGA